MSENAFRILHYFVETGLLFWFFSAVQPVGEFSRARRLCAYIPILCLAALYPARLASFDTKSFEMLMRFAYRMALCTVYLRLKKGIGWANAAYFSGIFLVIYHAHLNIFNTPMLHPIQYGHLMVSESDFVNAVVSQIIFYAGSFIILWIIRSSLPFNDIRRVGYGRPIMLLAAATATLYVKTTLTNMDMHDPTLGVEASLFPMLLEVFLLAMIVFFERYSATRRVQEAKRVQEVANEYILRDLRNRQRGEENMRALSHDMKNHLLALGQLTAEGRPEEINEYMNALLSKFDALEQTVNTGHELLNAIISAKMTEAANEGIEFTVVADFRPLSFISGVDLCTIFGNALDNAIEAARKVPDAARRFISVRGSVAAGQFIITIANSYEGEIKMFAGMPLTSKVSTVQHGIGLRNICGTLKKYGGVTTFDASGDGSRRFTLTMMLPTEA